MSDNVNEAIERMRKGEKDIEDCLKGKDLNGNDAEVLAEEIKRNKTLVKLHLSGNHIGDAGAQAIAEALKVNTTVTKLDLNYNQIGDAGAQAIGEALKVNTTVTALNLGYNQIGDAAAQAIGEALKVNTAVTELHLFNNQIGDAGAQAIAEALKVNTTVTVLNLWVNQIGDAGAQAIAEALKVNTAVTELNVLFNEINNTTLVALSETLDTNKALLTTHFPPKMTPQTLQTLITTNFQSIPTPHPPAQKLQHAAIHRAISLLKEKKEPLAALRPLAESIRQLFGQHPAFPSFDRVARSLFSAEEEVQVPQVPKQQQPSAETPGPTPTTDERTRLEQQIEKELLAIEEESQKIEEEKKRLQLREQQLKERQAHLATLQQKLAQLPPENSIPITLRLYDPPSTDATVHLITDPATKRPVQLGEGGYGAVYEAFYNGQPAALKVARLVARDDDEAAALGHIFRKEVGFLTTMEQNEHIVPVYASGDISQPSRSVLSLSDTYADSPAVVMKKAACTLWHALHSPKKCPPLIVDRLKSTLFKAHVLYAVSIALMDCHCDPMKRRTVKLAHRDVKSGNVLLTTDDFYTKPPEKLLSNVLLCDFGVSHQVKTTMGSSTFSVKAGTPSYMAPEVVAQDDDCKSNALDLFATDVFSYGILMWEVLSGQQPFAKLNPVKTAVAILGGNRPTPELTAADLVQGGWTREHAEVLAPLIKECWAQDPKDRPTMEAVSERLYPLLPKSHFV